MEAFIEVLEFLELFLIFFCLLGRPGGVAGGEVGWSVLLFPPVLGFNGCLLVLSFVLCEDLVTPVTAISTQNYIPPYHVRMQKQRQIEK